MLAVVITLGACHFWIWGCVNTGELEVSLPNVTCGRRVKGTCATVLCICDTWGGSLSPDRRVYGEHGWSPGLAVWCPFCDSYGGWCWVTHGWRGACLRERHNFLIMLVSTGWGAALGGKTAPCKRSGAHNALGEGYGLGGSWGAVQTWCVDVQLLLYSLGEPALDSPFPIFCCTFALAVHFWMITQMPDNSQTVATYVELILMVEVVMAPTRSVSITRNNVLVCHWAVCSLEVVSCVIGLLDLRAEVGQRSVGWVVGLLCLRGKTGRWYLHGEATRC